MTFNYKDHAEVPSIYVSYLNAVINEGESFKGIPIEDINYFLNQMEEWYAQEEQYDLD